MKCEECSSKMERIKDWLYKCPNCGSEMNVSPDFDEHEYHAQNAQNLLNSLLFGTPEDTGGYDADKYRNEGD